MPTFHSALPTEGIFQKPTQSKQFSSVLSDDYQPGYTEKDGGGL